MDNLKAAFNNNAAYKPYISSIVFPNYKNIWPGEQLTFDFPLTLLIGKNGTNKSSILHALYGCPDGRSTGEYWFSTYVDPIEKKPAYFYRYTIPETGVTAEVLKTTIKKKDDPDYWEPSRPILDHGMLPIPKIEDGDPLPEGRSKTRWNAIKKDVLYLDFRAEISAFDKAFYKANGSEARPAQRNRLRKQSKPLKEAIDENLTSKIHYQKERVFTNYTFTAAQRKTANAILDTEYTKIVYIEHDFYLSGSFSVYLRKGEEEDSYSEAFAGSGETSVIRLIYALDNAPANSLILLDEPETSLHIEAQYKLRDFIIERIKDKKLQVVISTHSPFFASGLPDCAIKVLHVDDASKKVKIINAAPADESSFHLGYRRNTANKVNVMVEDSLAYAVALHVYNKKLNVSQQDKIFVSPYSGGGTALLNLAVSEMLKTSSNVCFLFDGDQKLQAEIPDPNTIPASDNANLENIIKTTFGHFPTFPLDSNNEAQKIEYMRRYLDFARERFAYSPFKSPEEFIVANITELSSITGNPKNILRDHAMKKLGSSGDVKSKEILIMQRQLIADIPIDHEHFIDIATKLVSFLSHAPAA